MAFRSAISFDGDTAEIIAGINGKLGSLADGPADLAIAFVNSSDPDEAIDLLQDLQSASNASHFLGCTAGGIIGGGREIEHIGGASMVVGTIPNVAISGFYLGDSDFSSSLKDTDSFRSAIGIDDAPKLFIILVEPFSTPIREVLAAFDQTFPGVPVVGGIASGSSSPGLNTLAMDNSLYGSGTVGLAVAGEVDVEVIVSQGCQALGPLMEVTRSVGNVISELEGTSPLKVLQATLAELDARRRSMVQNGLLLGIVAHGKIDEPGPGDFLIRNIIDLDRSTGEMTVTDFVTPGQRVRFFVRDARSATDDLELLLSPQAFSDPPSVALLFTCNGRGTSLFGRPDGDITVVTEALGKNCPIVGFVCAGEIGPIGAKNYVHGQTASVVLIKPAWRQSDRSGSAVDSH